jgi:RNA polymerase I-specific transcription initiation factor RRN3
MELNTFFPFDPYRLPQSSVFVNDIYRDWASVAIEGDSDDDEDEVSDADGPGSIRERAIISGLPGHESKDSGAELQLGASFGGMSISPV